MTQKEIGIAIRDRRRQLGLTQGQLAELALCSKPSVIAAEAGKPSLRLDLLVGIVGVLGLELVVRPEREA